MMACVMVGWIIPKKEINDSFSDFKGRKAWLIFTKFITPILIGIVLFTSGLLKIDSTGVSLANWRMLVTVIVLVVTFVALNEIIIYYNKKKNPLAVKETVNYTAPVSDEKVEESVETNTNNTEETKE